MVVGEGSFVSCSLNVDAPDRAEPAGGEVSRGSVEVALVLRVGSKSDCGSKEFKAVPRCYALAQNEVSAKRSCAPQPNRQRAAPSRKRELDKY